MTSQVVQGTWLKKGGYGRFRGQCVKISSHNQETENSFVYSLECFSVVMLRFRLAR